MTVLRKWLALQLACLSQRIYDARHLEQLAILDRYGVPIIEWDIVGDHYGCGTSSQSGYDEFNGYKVKWEDSI